MKWNKVLSVLGVMTVIGVCLVSLLIDVFGGESANKVKDKEQEVVENVDSKEATETEVNNEVFFLIGNLHTKLNASLGYGHIHNFKSSTSIQTYYVEDIKSLIQRLEKENQNHTSINLYKDLGNIINLGEILDKGKGDKTTLKYLHRIVHDLDAFVLNDRPVKDYWKTIYTGNSSNVDDVEKHISKKLSIKLRDYRKQSEDSFHTSINQLGKKES